MRRLWRISARAALFALAVAPLLAQTPPTASPKEYAIGAAPAPRLRGISAVSASTAWASGANGTILRTVDGGHTWDPRPIPGTERLDFRDIDAFSDRVAYALSIGSGESSRIYKTIDGGASWNLQFANTDPKVFLDAMTFADETHGFAFSDSVNGKFVILTTSDGRAWTRVPDERLPPALPGEGAFAASGSNVAMDGRDRIWIGTTASRVLQSADGGRTWTVAKTPLATGSATGIFSIAFRDRDHGIVVGGNYQKEQDAIDNAAITSDGGATWTLVKGPGGFRSAVAWLPGSTQSVVAVGPSGIDLSSDGGKTWTAVVGQGAGAPGVNNEGFDAISISPDGAAWASGSGGRIAPLTAITGRTSAGR